MARSSLAGYVCMAKGCAALVRPPATFCARHWALVPSDLQQAIWGALTGHQHDVALADAVEHVQAIEYPEPVR